MALNEAQKKERSEYLEQNLAITECSQREPYVFISYASDDWETVFKTAVVPMQKQYGMRVYADKAFDRVNDRWIVPMLRNIRGAEVVVAFVSQSYIESYACFLELLTAVNSRRQIVFVSLEQTLRLGDTTDQPVMERGAKNEIMNQGANMVTNINNTSNDIMRAMKSAYTNISTLVEQDALSKYDISDAFINFFRDASVNRKTINDLNAVRRTIKSISASVFDPALITEPVKTAGRSDAGAASAVRRAVQAAPETAGTPEQGAAQASEARGSKTAPDAGAFGQAAAAKIPAQAGGPAGSGRPEPPADFTFEDKASTGTAGQQKAGGLLQNKGALCGIAAAAVLAVVLLVVLLSGRGDKEAAETARATESVQETAVAQETETQTAETQETQETETQTAETAQTEESGEEGPAEGAIPEGAVYEGDLVNGLPEGTGRMTYADGNVYEGEWKAGNREGQGTLTYADGSSYDGEWKAGEKDGQGKYIWASGESYDGEWKNGERSGWGKFTWPSGAVYEGEHKANKGDGQGIFIWNDGSFYEGGNKDGKYEGMGAWVKADGTLAYLGGYSGGHHSGLGLTAEGKYEIGYYAEDKLEGRGLKCSLDGEITELGTYKAGVLESEIKAQTAETDDGTYEGELSEEGVPEGMGVLRRPDGTMSIGLFREGKLSFGVAVKENYTYAGEVTDGAMTGYAAVLWDNGSLMVTDWENAKRNGFGAYRREDGTIREAIWKDDQIAVLISDGYGDVYEGERVNGAPEGTGKMTYANGNVYEGEWKAGRWEGQGTLTYPDGGVYEGEFQGGQFEGQGKFTWPNGDVYEGGWKDQKQEGQGTVTYASGATKTGVWKDGEYAGEQ